MRSVLKVIDLISEYSGRTGSWVCVALVLVLAYEVLMRYVFNAPTLWAHLTSTMLSTTLTMLGFAYVHLHRGHIRIDILYNRLSPRARAIHDATFTLLLFLPLLFILSYISASWMWESWLENEKYGASVWAPPAGPWRTVLLIGWSLFALQCLAQFMRDLYFVVSNKAYD